MNQKNVAQVRLQYYSPTQVALGIGSTTDDREKLGMQLLLISLLNLVNLVHRSKSDAKTIIADLKEVQKHRSNFVPRNEIVNVLYKKAIELIDIRLIRKESSLYLEIDTNDSISLFYRYSSVRALFQSVINLNYPQITDVLYECLGYVFEYYEKAKKPTGIKCLLDLTNYFSILFVDFLKE